MFVTFAKKPTSSKEVPQKFLTYGGSVPIARRSFFLKRDRILADQLFIKTEDAR